MAVGKKEEIMAVEIVKPRIDKRDYRRIVLQNNLEILLISDPETDKCAASMNVCVGAFSDPEGLEGLAHFLEHMLFYASEKYPVEDSYSKYITENGGSTNAFTSSEDTNYYFEVNADGFEEALDRFAQFFIKPLMSADATTREIKAVDSEHQKNLLSDPWRMNQLQKHLSAENHPYHKFSTGSWDTLEVRPKERGIDTRQELLKFYSENYSANLMHLVVYSKDSLDKVEQLVRGKFQDIRNIDRNQIHFTGQPCIMEHLQILVRAVPIKQGHKLKVIWPITPGIHHYKEGPCRYLGHLIGHEGEGSLFYVLKKLGWATSLSAGESDWTNEFSFFKVAIDLTDAGQDHFEDIMGLLFKYIHLLQQAGASKWIFEELSAICEIAFHYQDKIRPSDYVVNVAMNEAVMACREIEQNLQLLTGATLGEGTGATMSDDEDELQMDFSLDVSGGDAHDLMGMGFGLPTESERSLMERVRQELKIELKQGFRSRIEDVREEILRKRRAGKLPGDTTTVLKNWWQQHSKWPYPTEDDKAKLVEETGLQLKQINNWFINQRKRNWHSNSQSVTSLKSKRKR